MTADELLRALDAHYKDNYISSPVDGGALPLAAFYAMHSVDDKYVFFRQAVVGKVESDDFVYVFTPEQLTPGLLDEFLDFAEADALPRVDANPNHVFSLITVLIFSAGADAAAVKKIRKTKLHKEYKPPQAGWAELRIAALDLGGGIRAANPMGRDVAAAIKKALSAR